MGSGNGPNRGRVEKTPKTDGESDTRGEEDERERQTNDTKKNKHRLSSLSLSLANIYLRVSPSKAINPQTRTAAKPWTVIALKR